MRPAEKALVHQVHPAKIGTDVTASVISNALLWTGRPKAALAARAALPVASSLAVLAMADLDALAATRRGRYVLAHMPPSAQALRLAGDALMGWAAHRRRGTLLVAGAAVIAAGWSHAAWRRTSKWQRSPAPGCRPPTPEHELRGVTGELDAFTGSASVPSPARSCAGFGACRISPLTAA